MIENFTLNHQLNHRSIRKFKDQPLTKEQLTTLFEVARQTSTSLFLQQMSVIHVTDPKVKQALRQVSTQPYVGAQGELLVFIADLNRNATIRHQLGNHDDGRLSKTEMFLQAYTDATLAVQNVLNAVESMGLGGVILGSLQNDPAKVIQALKLPEYTYPVLGLQIGVPDQQPQLKPRLPLAQLVFENQYEPVDMEKLSAYDEVVSQYYDLRDPSRPVDTFTKQINGAKLSGNPQTRDTVVKVLHQQGLCMDL
ncbi:MAG: NADPH-dependent oxidoreductase [Ligilactobacillus agilis]|nr:NADPH-dependent oxidoreductase [Ligilactobacillus agilis]